MNKTELNSIIKRIQAIKDSANVDMQRSLERLFGNYFKEVYNRIADGSILSPTENEVGKLRIATTLNDILKEAGYKDFIQSYYDRFPELTEEVKNYFQVLGEVPTLASATQQSLTTWVKQTEENLNNKIDAKLVAPLQNLVLQNLIGGKDREEVAKEITRLESSLNYNEALTLANNYLSQYQRMAQVAIGEDLGLEVYIYVGPNDDITSQQCQDMLAYDDHVLKGAALKSEINSGMVDNLKVDPLYEGGHPNCRHHWLPVTTDYAVSLGFKP